MHEPGTEAPITRLENLSERGAFLEAADLAKRLLRDYADDGVDLHSASENHDIDGITYHHVWAVARSGGTRRALQLFAEYGMAERKDHKSQGLFARILKDQAIKTSSATRAPALKVAARAYADVFAHHGGHWPAVNAATLYLLSGNRDEAARWAEEVFKACAEDHSSTDQDGYFRAVSMAEASLVIGDVSTATLELWRAGTYETVGHATRATTRKQMRFICAANQLDTDILSLINVPEVIYYAGHIISPPGTLGRFPADQEDYARERIGRYLDNRDIGFAFGSLAAGSDILFAEACRDRGIDLHVVLPFDRDPFISTSVKPAGQDWVARFSDCLEWCEQGARTGTSSVTYATDGAFLGDESLFLYGAQYAMGLAVLRAKNLDTQRKMISIYDGAATNGVGTDGSIDIWTGLGFDCDIIQIDGGTKTRAEMNWDLAIPEVPERHPRAILYGDVEGFSDLKEEQLALFNNTIMSRISAVLQEFGSHVLYKNSFGDAVYVVIDSALEAARCALAIQRVFDQADFTDSETGSKLSFRLGGHFGPVFHGMDFIRNEPSFFGSHVTKVARIEPVTPPGAVYVTEPMAAALALSGNHDIECDYVGMVALAKNYGEFRMYVLRQSG